ncbi:MAG TPA: glycosyltransferase family 2 protein [Tepidisphaeraceae bacterium]|jgi:glycosyltransferase involved in cell wall biosynthesis
MPTSDPARPIDLPPLAQRPLVSVLIANYNYARFVPAALDSLLGQSYPHWEAVVLDDGSTDGSPAIIRGYVERDARIRLVEQPNGGQNAAVNACYRRLTGDIVCLLDSDDTFAPSKLRQVVDTLRANPAVGVVTHFCDVIDPDGRVRDVTLNSRLDRGWLGTTAFDRGGCVYVPPTSCMSFRREVIDLLMPLPPEQVRDADGYLGMAAQFLTPFAVIDAKLSGYRVHGNNMGGLTEPTPKRLHYELMLIGDRTANLKAFVAARFGPEIAMRLHIEDNPQYLQAALKLAAVGDRADRQRVGDARLLARRHPSLTWRAMWRAVLSLPGPLRRRVLPMIHRSHRLKAAIRRWFPRPAGAA